jgi:hypothetical protein
MLQNTNRQPEFMRSLLIALTTGLLAVPAMAQVDPCQP